MDRDLARLQVRIDADSARFDAAMGRAAQKFNRSSRTIEARAARLDNRVSNVGRRFGSGFNSNALRGSLGNVGQQIQDVAVQAQMGTDALIIFGQQGPQIAGAFGPLGAILGSVVAIGALLGTALANSGDQARSFEDAGESLGNTLRSLEEAGATLSLTLDEIKTRFGDNVVEVNRLRVAVAQTNLANYRQELRGVGVELDNVFAKFAADAPDLSIPGISPREIAGFRNSIRAIIEEFGVSEEAAIRLGRAFLDLRNSITFEDQARAMGEVQRLFDEFSVDVSNLPPEMAKIVGEMSNAQLQILEAEKAANDLENALGRGTDETGRFVDEMTRLKNEATAAAKAAQVAFETRSFLLSRDPGIAAEDQLFSLDVKPTAPPIRAARSSGRRSGGGRRRSAGVTRRDQFDQAQNRTEGQIRDIQNRIALVGKEGIALDQLRARQEAARIEERLLSEAKKQNGTVTEENRAAIDGLVNSYLAAADQLALATARQGEFEDAQRKNAEAARQAAREQEQLAQNLHEVAESMVSAISQADSFEDALKRVAVQLAQVVAQAAFGKGPLGALFNGITGGGIGGLFGFGGGAGKVSGSLIKGFASGGVAKGLSLVGERGPELVNFGSPSRVFSNSQSRDMMGGATLVQHFDFTNANVQAAQFRAIAREEGNRAVAALVDSRKDDGGVLR